jgi:SagB-type dehydrogenase family enzyme
MSRSREADVARLFHLHTRHDEARAAEAVIDHDRAEIRFRTYPDAPRTRLPGRDFALAAPLGEVLERRRSVREFAPGPLPLATLGRLLHTSYGIKGERREGEPMFERAAPSAGGLYPLEMYVATQSVEGLADGVYHYDALAHALELRRPGLAQPALVHLTLDQEMVRTASAVVIITAVPARTMVKYGQRGYRYLWLDAGHLGQNLYLCATALGLGPVGVGGFFDADLNALLSLPSGEEAFYVVAIGRPGKEPPSP